MINEKIIVLEKRRIIYNFILNNPGLHLREISRRLNIPKTTLNHHITQLKKRDLIAERRNKRFVRYYIRNNVDRNHKEIINFIRQEVPRDIIIMIFTFVGCSKAELSQELQKHHSTISFHLKKLIDNKIIEPAGVGDGYIYRKRNGRIIKRPPRYNETVYCLKDTYSVFDTFITYKESLPNDLHIVAFIDDIEKKPRKNWLPKQINSSKLAIDSVIDTFYEIFPLPFRA